MLKEFLQGRALNHPLHPLLVHLPVGLWVANLIFDIMYMSTGNPGYAVTAFYCLTLGIIGAVFAAITGIADYLEIESGTLPKRIATYHLLLNVFVVCLYVVNFFLRHFSLGGVHTRVT